MQDEARKCGAPVKNVNIIIITVTLGPEVDGDFVEVIMALCSARRTFAHYAEGSRPQTSLLNLPTDTALQSSKLTVTPPKQQTTVCLCVIKQDLQSIKLFPTAFILSQLSPFTYKILIKYVSDWTQNTFSRQKIS